MGAVSFPAASGGSTVQTSFNPPANVSLKQTITSSGAVTIPSSVTAVFIIAIGGGGGGGGNGTGQPKGGGGAGGGGVVTGWVTPFSSVVIGAGGAGGNSGLSVGPLWGAFGGYTQVGRFIMVGGGGGGGEGVAGNAGGGGSANYYNYTTMPGYLGGAQGAPAPQNGVIGYVASLFNPPSISMSGLEGFSNYMVASSYTSQTVPIAAGGGTGQSFNTLSFSTLAYAPSNGIFTGGGGSAYQGNYGGGTSTYPTTSSYGGNGYLAASYNALGGSGGGGGGAGNASTNAAGGAGGSGCVLIYY